MGTLYYGDNLPILRTLPSNSVDLVYLDPPFNSKRDYNLLFRSPAGEQSDAQITAFEDSWHWGEQAERERRQRRTHRSAKPRFAPQSHVPPNPSAWVASASQGSDRGRNGTSGASTANDAVLTSLSALILPAPVRYSKNAFPARYILDE